MQEEKRGADKTEINLLDLVKAVLSKWWIILIAAAVVGLGAFLYCQLFVTPMYAATTSMCVINSSGSTGTVTYADTQLGLQIMNDYKEVVTSATVLNEVIEKQNLETTVSNLRSRVTLTNAENTRILYVTVLDPDPVCAKNIANEIRKSSAEQIKEIFRAEAVNTVDEAVEPTSPSSPRVFRITVIGALIGAFLVIVLLVILYLADTSIKDIEDVERYLGLSTLASIPIFEDEASAAQKNKKRAAVKKI